jgi:hypothetical protein
VLLTDSREALSHEEAVALGADDRIYEPFPVDIVEQTVACLLVPRPAAGACNPPVVTEQADRSTLGVADG